MTEIKKYRIDEVLEEMNNSTNFILIVSSDNCDSTEYIRFNVSNIEAIGMTETVKHHLLHDVMAKDDDPTSHDEYICGGN